jgi:hypothetical protein
VHPFKDDGETIMDETTLAYLAGAMDSDGSFGIKRHTYAMRIRGDASQPVYSERASLKQVTPEIPHLLKDTFGGRCAPQNASSKNGRPLWGWDATDVIAATAAKRLLPFLRVKKPQAELMLELRRTKTDDRYKQIAYWFEQEHPGWRQLPMLTYTEVAQQLGYKTTKMVSQAVSNGSLLALPYATMGVEIPRVPTMMVAIYAEHAARSKDGRGRCRPTQLIAWRERLWNECRELNRIGTGQHPIYMRTGCFTPK